MKLYDENEVGAILKKAAENSHRDRPGSTVGLSIDELQQLASDAGIDPDEVVKAVAELEKQSDKKKDESFWGGPFSFSREIEIDGEITTTEWEAMLVAIRDFFQGPGRVSTRAKVFEWTTPMFAANDAQVTARKANGKTYISVFWNGRLNSIPFYIPVPLVAILSLLIGEGALEMSAVPGITFVLAMSSLAFLGGRWALSRFSNKRKQKLDRLMTGFEMIASKDGVKDEKEEASDPIKQEQIADKKPLIDLDDAITDDQAYVESRIRERS